MKEYFRIYSSNFSRQSSSIIDILPNFDYEIRYIKSTNNSADFYRENRKTVINKIFIIYHILIIRENRITI